MTSERPTTPNDYDHAVYASNPYRAQQQSTKTLGILSLIGGAASIVFGQLVILPIAAIILGFISRSKEPDAKAFATWGIVLGFLSLFGWIIIALVAAALAAPLFIFSFF